MEGMQAADDSPILEDPPFPGEGDVVEQISPQEARQRVYDVIFCFTQVQFWIVFTFAAIVLLVCLSWSSKHTGCGIPIYMWIEIYFVLVIIKAFFILGIPCIFWRNPRALPKYWTAYFLTMSWI